MRVFGDKYYMPELESIFSSDELDSVQGTDVEQIIQRLNEMSEKLEKAQREIEGLKKDKQQALADTPTNFGAIGGTHNIFLASMETERSESFEATPEEGAHCIPQRQDSKSLLSIVVISDGDRETCHSISSDTLSVIK